MSGKKVAVVGSRSFCDRAKMAQVLDKLEIAEIVSGGAVGADKLAEDYASEKGLPVVVFLPKFKTDQSVLYHPKWFMVRNREIVDYSDIVIAFWDGKTTGTKYTIGYAQKVGKPVEVTLFIRYAGV